MIRAAILACLAATSVIAVAVVGGTMSTASGEADAGLQNKCCSCGGAFPADPARLCNSCSSRYRSKCVICNGAFPKDIARLCNSCASRLRTKCFICQGAFPKDVARLCNSCSSRY